MRVTTAGITMAMETFKKLPLGGVDRRSLIKLLAEKGADAAAKVLDHHRSTLTPVGVDFPDDVAVVILGGSNGITRAIATQLLLAEGVDVVGVHYDSAKMQIGVHHVAALEEAAAEKGRKTLFVNRDATRDKSIAEAIDHLKGSYRAVHLINGIAAGATKRYEKHGPTQVPDLDMAFDPVLQVPLFGEREGYRKLGLVDVETASENEIERTNKLMGHSSTLWAEALAEAGLLAAGESLVAFCDYDFEETDPVYGMGPLAGAKVLQREGIATIRERFGVRTCRVCYPPMATTALGAIPGGSLMYGLSAEILFEQDQYRNIEGLAEDTMKMWKGDGDELRLDDAYQACLPEFHRRKDALTPDDVPAAFEKVWSSSEPL